MNVFIALYGQIKKQKAMDTKTLKTKPNAIEKEAV